jgi:hypothetical protein
VKEYRFIGSHPETLDGGRPIEPGEFTGPIDEKLPQNEHLVDSGALLTVPDGTYDNEVGAKLPDPPILLTGKALQDRAEELDIEGRTKMSADELREAVRIAEATNTEEGDNA